MAIKTLIISLVIIVVVSGSLFIYNSNLIGTPSPYYQIPINLSKAGDFVETDLKIKDTWTLQIYLDRDYFKNTPEELDKIIYLYRKYLITEDDQYPDLPMKITISKYTKDGKVVIIDEISDTKLTGGAGRGRTFVRMSFKKGKYHIRVENIKDFPELKDFPVFIKFRHEYSK